MPSIEGNLLVQTPNEQNKPIDTSPESSPHQRENSAEQESQQTTKDNVAPTRAEGANSIRHIPTLILGFVRVIGKPAPKWVKHVKNSFLVVILASILTLFTTIIPGVNSIYNFLRPTPPMAGEFNVAIAKFAVLDSSGKKIRSQDGLSVANFLYRRLKSNFERFDLGDVDYELRSPDVTGEISGKTSQERRQKAQELAAKLHANIIIYGLINEGDNPQLMPEFYVNYQGFDQIDEILGQHEIGSPLLITLPFNESEFQDVNNPALSARATALSMITIGLAYYSVDNLEQARAYFSQAAETNGWLDTAGKEIVYFMLGNTYVSQASLEKSSDALTDALIAYQTALSINPSYARARLGQAGVLYLQALGDPAEPVMVENNDKLIQAEKAFLDTLEISDPDQLTEENIGTKVHFYLGQIYIARSQIDDPSWLQTAEGEFDLVIEDYLAGDDRVKELASHAFARRGLIAMIQQDRETAKSFYQSAIEITSPRYKAYYSSKLAEIYFEEGSLDQALETYDKAIQIAEFYGYPQDAQKYLDARNKLETQK